MRERQDRHADESDTYRHGGIMQYGLRLLLIVVWEQRKGMRRIQASPPSACGPL